MSKYIELELPSYIEDDVLRVIILLTKMEAQNRRYTGYKELEENEIDLDWFLSVTGSEVNSKGAIYVQSFSLYWLFHFNLPRTTYYLDTDIFFQEEDIIGAFKTRDPVWFMKEDEYKQYNEELFEKLPPTLKRWFLKTVKFGSDVPAQDLLEATYKKYVVEKKEMKSIFPKKSK